MATTAKHKSTPSKATANRPVDLLERWLGARLSEEHISWLQSQLKKILNSNSDRELHITLGLIPRRLGRADLNLSTSDLAQANTALNGWNPAELSLDSAARIAVLCRLAEHDADRFADSISDLCRGADLAESIAIYSGIALFPDSKQLDDQVAEGLRTNMRAVFEAIAHYNPYPATHFDEHRWNHMVLKALFIDSTLAPIYGIDPRCNKDLATTLCDYAHERWAASRPVTAELWRCVGPYASGFMINDLQRAAQSSVLAEHQAGVLALNQCPDMRVRDILAGYPETTAGIASGEITWNTIFALQQNPPGNPL